MDRVSRETRGPGGRGGRSGTGRGAGRSYDQYCALARALDAVGDRWALLIVRELLGGPRRYTALHADLPGVSTDVLASRLRDLERHGVVTKVALPAPASGSAYRLTERGRALLPAVTELAAWGADRLGERHATDAVRVHWYALPLRAVLLGAGARGVLDVITDDGVFHLRLPGDDSVPVHGDGPAEPAADASLHLDTATLAAVCRGDSSLSDALRSGTARLDGDGRTLGAPADPGLTATSAR